MIFRQFLDPETSTYTYLLADQDTREALLIDPVLEQLERDAELLAELDLELLYALETHVHADHVTAGGRLRERLGCRLGVSAQAGVVSADLQLRDGERLAFGRHSLEVRATPGHTDGCVTYVSYEAGLACTGDALLIRGCGRTDFQSGDAATLFASVRERIFSLPGQTLLYPGHDYRGRTVSTVAEERVWNPRLGDAHSTEEFVRLMAELRLEPPRRIDEAVPANLRSGLLEPAAAELLAKPGPVEEIWLGMGI